MKQTNVKQRKDFKFEVCANGVESCLAAQQGGADRVELCAGIPEGGTTPSYGEIAIARKLLHETKLHVIIRPRGGDFLYTPLEVERMVADIDMAHRLGADGVVFGCLNQEGEIDMELNRRLMECSKGMSVTFHRAFDRCKNPLLALEQLISLGFHRILTSGQMPTAEQGIPLLVDLFAKAEGRIGILAGCGVNEQNIDKIYQETGITEYHFSGREKKQSKMAYHNAAVYMGTPGKEEDVLEYTSAERVRATISRLTNLP